MSHSHGTSRDESPRYTNRPSWAVETETDRDFVVYRGRRHEHAGFSGHLTDLIPNGEDARSDVTVCFESFGFKEPFNVPVGRLDDLITLLSRVRGSIAIRPETGEVVSLDSAGVAS